MSWLRGDGASSPVSVGIVAGEHEYEHLAGLDQVVRGLMHEEALFKMNNQSPIT